MKKTLVLILSGLFLLTCSEKVLAYSTAGESSVYNGNMVVTWVTQDNNGNGYVWGAAGSVTDDPTNWSKQDISVGGGSPNVSAPYIYTNQSTGDSVVVWQYYDANNGIMRVAAARMPASGFADWDWNTISDITTEYSGNEDAIASIDADGNIMITWSAFDLNTFNYAVRCVIGTIDTSIPWSNSFILPGANFQNSKARPPLPSDSIFKMNKTKGK